MPRYAARSVSTNAPNEQTSQQGRGHSIQSKYPNRLPAEQANIRLLRVWRRAQTRINVEFMTEQGCQAAVIRNISHHGAGLTGSFDATRGEVVTLHFDDGRLIPVQVRWHRGCYCGVSFLEPLTGGDPLLIGLFDTVPAPRQVQGVAATGASFHTKQRDWVLEISIELRRKFVFLIQTAVSNLEGLRTHKIVCKGRSAQSRDAQMLARACRKQGYAWLVESSDFD